MAVKPMIPSKKMARRNLFPAQVSLGDLDYADIPEIPKETIFKEYVDMPARGEENETRLVLFIENVATEPLVCIVRRRRTTGEEIVYKSVISLRDAIILAPDALEEVSAKATRTLDTARINYLSNTLFSPSVVKMEIKPSGSGKLSLGNHSGVPQTLFADVWLSQQEEVRKVYRPKLEWHSSTSSWKLVVPSFTFPISLGVALWNDEDAVSGLIEKMKDPESLWVSCALDNPEEASRLVLNDKYQEVIEKYKIDSQAFKSAVSNNWKSRKEELEKLANKNNSSDRHRLSRKEIYSFVSDYIGFPSFEVAQFGYSTLAIYVGFENRSPYNQARDSKTSKISSDVAARTSFMDRINEHYNPDFKRYLDYKSNKSPVVDSKKRASFDAVLQEEFRLNVEAIELSGWRVVPDLRPLSEGNLSEGFSAWFTCISEDDWEKLSPIFKELGYRDL